MEYFVTALREHQELTIFLTVAVGFAHRSAPDRLVQPRHRRGNPAGGRAHRAARHQGGPRRQERLLRSVPVHHRLQGGAPVLPRPEEGRAAAAGGHRRAVRHVPGQRASRPRSSSGTTWERPPGSSPGPSRSPRSSAPPATRSTASTLPAAEKTALVNNIPVAYAVTYLIGTAVHRVVPAERRTQADGNQPEGGRPEAAGPGGWRRRVGAGRDLGAPEVRGPRVPCDERATAEPDGRLDRGAAGRASASSSRGSVATTRSSSRSRTRSSVRATSWR